MIPCQSKSKRLNSSVSLARGGGANILQHILEGRSPGSLVASSWLSPPSKWPILCRVGRINSTHSLPATSLVQRTLMNAFLLTCTHWCLSRLLF